VRVHAFTLPQRTEVRKARIGEGASRLARSSSHDVIGRPRIAERR
jgi:hypothetical protein